MAESKDINDTMKTFIFFRSLSGTHAEDLAEVFAVHNKKNNKVELVETLTLF